MSNPTAAPPANRTFPFPRSGDIYGEGSSVEPPPYIPQRQPAPPQPPTGQGGGGDDDGELQLPAVPPIPGQDGSLPYVVRSVSVANTNQSMFVVAAAPWNRAVRKFVNIADLRHPLPDLFAVYIFPVVYTEVVTKQFFHPPGPFVYSPSLPAAFNNTEEQFRAWGWVADQPDIQHLPVFVIDRANTFIRYDPNHFQTEFTEWCLGTCWEMNYQEIALRAKLISKDCITRLWERRRKVVPMQNVPTADDKPIVCATPEFERFFKNA